MRFSRFLETRLDIAQCGVPRFKIGARLPDLGRQSLPFELRFVAPQQPQQLLLAGQLVAPGAILACDASLSLEALHLRSEFEADVFDAGQVVAGIGEPMPGFLAPLLVARHAGSFFEEDTQLVGPGLDDPRNGALTDDRIGARAQAGAKEKVGHVLPANVQIVDVVLGLAATRQQALDRQLRVLRPLPGKPPERIVEDQLDGCPRDRLARSRTIEDHVLHRFATQLGRLRLTKHPAHRIDHVRLAATIRPNDADQLPGQRDVRWIDK